LQTSDRTARDSIYLHDSIRVEYRRGNLYHSSDSFNSLFIRSPDTVYLEKWHTRWREKEVTRIDTVTQEVTRIETKEVRHVPKFYKWCAVVAALLSGVLVLRVTARLTRMMR
jgi:hypothetical protein